MKTTWLIFIIILNIPLCKGHNYGDKQIEIMLSQYYTDSPSYKLLGNHIFSNNNDIVFQIEVQTSIEDFNSSMLDAFAVINKLSDVAKTKFTKAVVIFHFDNNKLPIIAEAGLHCSKKFFIKKTQDETQWRKNCLSIQTQ